MAISSEVRSAGPFTCDGTTRQFPFSFKILKPSQLVVLSSNDNGETESALSTTLFDVSLNKNQDVTPGGTVTFKQPPANGTLLVILSNVEYLQPMVLTNHGGFYPDVLNEAQDRGVILAQQNRELIKRSVTVSLTSSETPEEFKKRFFAAHSETVESKNRAEAASSLAQGSAQDAKHAVKEAQTTLLDTQSIKRSVESIASQVAQDKSLAAASARDAAQALSETKTAQNETQALKSQIDRTKVEVDRSAQDARSAAALAHDAQVQSDWAEMNESSKAFIHNKPDVLTPQNLNSAPREISAWTVTPGNGVATSSLFFQVGNSHKYEVGIDNNQGEFFIWDKKNNANVARLTRSSAQLYGNLNMNGNYLSNVHEPSSDTDGATKRYVDNGLRGKANTSHTHQASEISGLPAPVDTSTLVKASGERGPLGGYELAQVLSGNTCSVGTSSKDTLVWKTSGACTLTILPDSNESHCAVKLLYMKATAQTTLSINGGRFVGGKKPTWGTAGKRLTLACHFVNGEVNISVVENEEG